MGEGRRMNRAATLNQPPASQAAHLRDAPVVLPLADPDLTWDGEPQVVEELLSGRRSEIAGPLDRPRTTVIKSGPHRAVYRIELPSGPVFLKHCKIPDWRALVRNLLSGSPVAREAAAAARVGAAGIETTVVAAFGRIRRRLLVRDSFLMTREIADVRPLDQVLRERLGTWDHQSPTERTGRFRRELACSLGQLAGRLHRHRLTHGDLHPANILINANSDDAIRLALIDLQRVRTSRLLTFSDARIDLFGLYNSFNALAGRSDRRRFFETYSNELRPSLSVGAPRNRDIRKGEARAIEAYCLRALRQEQIQNDRKWQRTHRRLVVADRGCQIARGLTAVGQAAVIKYRENPDLLFHENAIRFWRRRAPNHRSAVVNLPIGERTVACDVREARRPLRWRDFVFRWGWSETRRAWEMGHALIRRRIATGRPLLYVRSQNVSCVREFLVTEPVDGMVTLSVFLAHHLPRMTSADREDWLSRRSGRLAGLLKQLRQFSFVHTQLTAGNILVGVEPHDPRMQIAGVQHIARKRWINRRDVAIELNQLEASLRTVAEIRLTHRMRFLRAYLGNHAASALKPVWKTVQAKVSAINCLPVQKSRSLSPGSIGRRIPSRAAVFLAALALCIFAGCQTVDHPVGLPVRYSVPGDQLLVLSDFKLPKDHELIRELNGLREQVTSILELPVKRDPVVVYLFNNETEYRRYMNATYPRLPPRSAYFVGTPTELAVYTHWGQNVREDLRHEYTHGLLHSGLKRVPLWLDEGLAEYFEVAGPKPGGLNHDYAQHLSEAVASGWRPDLKRLENLDDSGQMKRAEYQESWAWVHFFLNSTPEAKQALVSYLADLRTNPHAKTISNRLRTVAPEYDARFVSYISQLRPPATQVGAL
jgi:tRNA A-37 threonylcarbamoyl transferase component Bud32